MQVTFSAAGGGARPPAGLETALPLALVELERATVRLDGLERRHLPLLEPAELEAVLLRHYSREFIRAGLSLASGLSVLGDPMGALNHLGAGVYDFFAAPLAGFQHSVRREASGPAGGVGTAQAVLLGVLAGTRSLVSNTIFALSNAAYQTSSSGSKVILVKASNII